MKTEQEQNQGSQQPAAAPAQPAQQQQQSAPEAVQDPAILDLKDQMDQIVAMGYGDSPEYKELQANYNAMIEMAKGQPAAAPAAPAQPAAAAPEAVTAPAPGSEAALASAFFGKITPADGKPIEFKELSDVNRFLAEKLGISLEPEKPESLLTLAEKASAWKRDADEKPLIEGQYNALAKDIENLPDPLFNAMQKWARGEDWQQELTASRGLDFSKPLTDADKVAAINHYFPGKFKAETLQQGGELVDAAFDLAKIQFSKDQTAFSNERKNILAAAEKSNKARMDSVSESIALLKKDYPALDNNDVLKVEDALKKGSLMSFFVDDSGQYRPEAAKRLAMVLKGEDEIKTLITALKQRNETAAAIVNSGRTEVERPGAQAQVPATEADFLKEMANYSTKSVYDSVG